MTADVWLRAFGTPPARPRHRLICFPHAGGSASFFQDWASLMPEADVRAVRYPGRAERIAEPLPADLRWLATQIAEALHTLPRDCPLVLFGHSMGALVALETARSLEAGGSGAAHLYASGSRDCPGPPPDLGEYVEADSEAAAAALIRLGGTEPGLASDPFFLQLVLPYVHSDCRMLRAYTAAPEPVLRCPITTIVGDADKEADLRPWRTLTAGTFTELTVPGDHFYLITEPPHTLLRP
ncbi:thioesterase II family protein [Longispora albida]|uniref:thioesterase II family protein n=1 Tax=Longispora albida TaxID=203523 RepID=UPI0003637A7A|nr:alpha/beta fold hydrolase [Longispora albida]